MSTAAKLLWGLNRATDQSRNTVRNGDVQVDGAVAVP